jgi:hypothetical protein
MSTTPSSTWRWTSIALLVLSTVVAIRLHSEYSRAEENADRLRRVRPAVQRVLHSAYRAEHPRPEGPTDAPLVRAHLIKEDSWAMPLEYAIRRMVREGVDEPGPIPELRNLARMCEPPRSETGTP